MIAQILDILASGERPVSDLVMLLSLAQPLMSKHLRVLREVGLVEVRDDGRQRLYRLNGHALKPIHDWVTTYAWSWSQRFERLDAVSRWTQPRVPQETCGRAPGGPEVPC